MAFNTTWVLKIIYLFFTSLSLLSWVSLFMSLRWERDMKLKHQLSTVCDILFDCEYSFVGYIYRASQDVSESRIAKVLWTVCKYIARFHIAVLRLF